MPAFGRVWLRQRNNNIFLTSGLDKTWKALRVCFVDLPLKYVRYFHPVITFLHLPLNQTTKDKDRLWCPERLVAWYGQVLRSVQLENPTRLSHTEDLSYYVASLWGCNHSLQLATNRGSQRVVAYHEWLRGPLVTGFLKVGICIDGTLGKKVLLSFCILAVSFKH